MWSSIESPPGVHVLRYNGEDVGTLSLLPTVRHQAHRLREVLEGFARVDQLVAALAQLDHDDGGVR